jgi:hypothetical protein
MSVSLGRRRVLLLAALQGSVAALSGCGTILHPERRGQPGGRLDWKIVALNGVGLLFFFIPGIIAFAIDFATGAIYLPPEDQFSQTISPADKRLVKISASSQQPSVEEVEEIVSRHVGRKIALEPGKFVTEPLKDLADFWTCRARLLRGREK